MLWRALWIWVLAGVLAGCAPTLIPSGHNNFDGIAQLAAAATSERPLRILIVHGMATDAPDAFDDFIAGTAARLGLVQTDLPQMVPTPAPGGVFIPDPVYIQTRPICLRTPKPGCTILNLAIPAVLPPSSL
jgi:hypothetical protein